MARGLKFRLYKEDACTMYVAKTKALISRTVAASWSAPLLSHMQKVFSSETAWPIKAKFYVEPPWEGGTKVCINGPGHMTKMAAMPIYGKNLKNLLLQNQKSYDLETWHVASGTQALQSLYKW